MPSCLAVKWNFQLKYELGSRLMPLEEARNNLSTLFIQLFKTLFLRAHYSPFLFSFIIHFQNNSQKVILLIRSTEKSTEAVYPGLTIYLAQECRNFPKISSSHNSVYRVRWRDSLQFQSAARLAKRASPYLSSKEYALEKGSLLLYSHSAQLLLLKCLKKCRSTLPAYSNGVA